MTKHDKTAIRELSPEALRQVSGGAILLSFLYDKKGRPIQV